MRQALILFTGIAVFGACSTRAVLTRDLTAAEKKFQDHTGFMLYDPATKKTLLDYHASSYFIPASNTKIFTLYTALRLLGDSIPAVKYDIRHDSLLFRGTGDPGFLYHRTFDNGRTFAFLRKNSHRLFVSFRNFQTDVFGPGWAWDDYNYVYSAERSPFPVYGNLATIKKTGAAFAVTPNLLSNHFLVGDSVATESVLTRDPDSNQLTYMPGREKSPRVSWEIPFRYSPDLIVELLSDTLGRDVEEINMPVRGDSTLYSVPADSLYAVMMKASDNFIAEQLLLMCAGLVSDTLKPEIAIRYAKKNFLADLLDEPTWVDGSGLSRYNLFTPRTIVTVWNKIYEQVPRERLFKLLAVGGQTGTLKNFAQTGSPFIFGKSGSLSNNASLSGFVITKKNKVLIFSFMIGNFVVPGRDIRAMMQQVLTKIRNAY